MLNVALINAERSAPLAPFILTAVAIRVKI